MKFWAHVMSEGGERFEASSPSCARLLCTFFLEIDSTCPTGLHLIEALTDAQEYPCNSVSKAKYRTFSGTFSFCSYLLHMTVQRILRCLIECSNMF